MLQSFPAESNGRRKKLQEVKHQLFKYSHSGLYYFFSPNVYTLFLSLLCMVGWLRDSYMLYVFPHQVYHGKVTHKHIVMLISTNSSYLLGCIGLSFFFTRVVSLRFNN